MGEGDERPEEAGEETRGNRFCPGEKMLVLSLLQQDRATHVMKMSMQ